MIDLGRWQEIKDLVQATLDESPEERDEYLDSACEGDRELRAAVEALLQVSETSAHLYDDLQFIPEPVRELTLSAGDSVGPYTVVRSLGRGGMSSVYLADDAEHERHLALKVLPPRLFRLSPREHKLLARLNHPNIATLFSSGTTSGGFRYLALEYVEGSRLTDYCTERGLTLEERLKLFAKVCDAVSYAHAKTIVHRDLTPNNILVTESGEPKLLDFGIAKELPTSGEAATLTEAAQRPLTLSFSSPEQLSGEETGTASDIYSLGVLLCVLLTGRLPYKVRSAHDLPWAIRNQDPERPSDLIRTTELEPLCGPPPGVTSRRLQGDLDAIVHRALRKEPDQRYSSVLELVADIRHHLLHEPVLARQGSRRYRTSRFLRRHRVSVAIAASLLLLIAAFLGLLIAQREEVRLERDRATQEAARSQAVLAFLLSTFEVSDPWTNPGESITAREILNRSAERLRSDEALDPITRATTVHTIASVYINLGLYSEAEALLAYWRPQLANALAETSLDLARLNHAHAVALRNLGRLNEALTLAEDSLAVRRQALGENHLDTWQNLGTLAHIRYTQGDYETAADLFQMELTQKEQVLGPDAIELADPLNNLAASYEKLGRYNEAKDFHQRALEIRKRHLGPDHIDVSTSLNNLAVVARRLGESSDAERYYKAALTIRQRVLGKDHPMTLNVMHNLAVHLAHVEQYGASEEYLLEVIQGRRRSLGPNHPDVARSLGELAGLYSTTGRLREAEKLFLQSLSILRSELGEDHHDHLVYMSGVASVFQDQKEWGKAEDVFRGILESLRRQGIKNFTTVRILNNLAFTLEHRSRYREALPVYSEALSMAEGILGSDSEAVGRTALNLARLLLRLDEVANAITLGERALKILDSALPENHSVVVKAKLVLGECYLKAQRFEEAEPLLLAALEGIQNQQDPEPDLRLQATRSVVSLYEAQGELKKAAKYSELIDLESVN